MKKKDKKIVSYAVASVLAANAIFGSAIPQEIKDKYEIVEEDMYDRTYLADYAAAMRRAQKTRKKKNNK